MSSSQAASPLLFHLKVSAPAELRKSYLFGTDAAHVESLSCGLYCVCIPVVHTTVAAVVHCNP